MIALATLKDPELFWQDHAAWLESNGYKLRARYQPGWEPNIPVSRLIPSSNEDFFSMARMAIVDAVRMEDGKRVLLKRVLRSDHPHEVAITKYFSTTPLSNDTRNHCVQLQDMLYPANRPDTTILVFPFLQQLTALRFDTIAEILDFIRQIFGLQFMHRNHVAHRDIDVCNIMMDGEDFFPEGWNQRFPSLTPDGTRRAKAFTRTQRPPKYYSTTC
ncbi:hypothetical protein BDN72DRAFT_81534 [Pluteus cervinus]|uniref:Uncharacterized protein n=1 Tax=Pluteus cervinus TaxID=181527 RepID=A0ACD3B910_9AGAR|nr:hypothetical protein BDN72DRAFT_81534 [Pluteus cervinus]